MRTYKDDFGNRATIKRKYILPYRGAAGKEPAYILTCYSEYDNDLIYHVTVHESKAEAEEQLKEFSCGTFKAV